MGISVNGIDIDDADIAQELPHHQQAGDRKPPPLAGG